MIYIPEMYTISQIVQFEEMIVDTSSEYSLSSFKKGRLFDASILCEMPSQEGDEGS